MGARATKGERAESMYYSSDDEESPRVALPISEEDTSTQISSNDARFRRAVIHDFVRTRQVMLVFAVGSMMYTGALFCVVFLMAIGTHDAIVDLAEKNTTTCSPAPTPVADKDLCKSRVSVLNELFDTLHSNELLGAESVCFRMILGHYPDKCAHMVDQDSVEAEICRVENEIFEICKNLFE